MPDTTHKIGKRYKHGNLVMWAEEGLIVMESQKDGSCTIETRSEMRARAIALNKEAHRADEEGMPEIRDNLNDWVIVIGEVWREAKEQGDPEDIEVIKSRIRERRKAILVKGMW